MKTNGQLIILCFILYPVCLWTGMFNDWCWLKVFGRIFKIVLLTEAFVVIFTLKTIDEIIAMTDHLSKLDISEATILLAIVISGISIVDTAAEIVKDFEK